MLESTTLMLGYALGDMNVRAAMAWAKAFCGAEGLVLDSPQGLVVQGLYVTRPPAQEPYLGPDGELVLELQSIGSLLEEISARRSTLNETLVGMRNEIATFLASEENAGKVAADAATRKQFLDIVGRAQWPLCATSIMLRFLDSVLTPVWERARQPNHFSYYDTFLTLLLDVVEKLDTSELHPNVLAYLGDALDRVGEYIGDGFGYAWEATATWRRRVPSVDPDLLAHLRAYGKAYDRHALVRLIDGVPGQAQVG